MADPGAKITPQVEIAWARAVSRAFDDPAFYRRLQGDPGTVLTELGADVSGINVKEAIKNEQLKPSLKTLNEVTDDLEMRRAALRAVEPSRYQTPSSASGQPMQSGMPAYPTSSYLLVPTVGSPFQSCSTTGCMTVQTYASPACASFRIACIAASQVATTRPSAAPGDAAPQWIGGRPSGGAPL